MAGKKQLRFNQFGESILADYDSFKFAIKSSKSIFNSDELVELLFDWSWNNYFGYGSIIVNKNNGNIHDDSSMTVSSKSPRQQANGRNTCSQYNDKALRDLFVKMLLEFPNSI